MGFKPFYRFWISPPDSMSIGFARVRAKTGSHPVGADELADAPGLGGAASRRVRKVAIKDLGDAAEAGIVRQVPGQGIVPQRVDLDRFAVARGERDGAAKGIPLCSAALSAMMRGCQ